MVRAAVFRHDLVGSFGLRHRGRVGLHRGSAKYEGKVFEKFHPQFWFSLPTLSRTFKFFLTHSPESSQEILKILFNLIGNEVLQMNYFPIIFIFFSKKKIIRFDKKLFKKCLIWDCLKVHESWWIVDNLIICNQLSKKLAKNLENYLNSESFGKSSFFPIARHRKFILK